MRLKFRLIFFSCLVCVAVVRAQISSNELDARYTPNQNSVFNNGVSKSNNSTSSNEIKTSIRFSPTFLLRRKAIFFIERDLNNGISLNVAVGKAFGTDVFQDILVDFDFDLEVNKLSATKMLANSQYSSSSAFYSIGPKFYYSGETFDNFYMELYYRHEKMNYVLESSVSGRNVVGSKNVSFTMNAFGMGCGFSNISGKVTHDFFMQVGVKLIAIPRYELITTQSDVYYERQGTTDLVRLFPAINIGYAIGLGF